MMVNVCATGGMRRCTSARNGFRRTSNNSHRGVSPQKISPLTRRDDLSAARQGAMHDRDRGPTPRPRSCIKGAHTPARIKVRWCWWKTLWGSPAPPPQGNFRTASALQTPTLYQGCQYRQARKVKTAVADGLASARWWGPYTERSGV